MGYEQVLEVGDWLPDFGLLEPSGRLLSLHHQSIAGQPMILFLRDGPRKAASEQELDRLAAAGGQLERLGVRVIAIERTLPEASISSDLPFTTLADPSDGLFSRLAVDWQAVGRGTRLPGCMVVLADGSLRIRQKLAAHGEVGLAKQAVKAAERLADETTATVCTVQAPVLTIPAVFDPDLCRRLIDCWRDGQRFSGGVAVSSLAANINVDYGHKKREDVVVPEGPLFDRVRQLTIARVFPDMVRAFQYQPTRHEAYRIGCYDAESGGYFRRHRDNRTPQTQHRRYAITFMLNDDYDGGYLKFPEYGPTLYKPPVGGAVVFSCNLLHEVTDVTRGRRFVVVTFFYGEAEAADLARRMQKA